MKSAIAVFVVSAAMGAATVHAQTPGSQTSPQSTQQRPDARYPNPSGQDSAPNQTTVPPTKTAPPSGHPEDPATTSTKGKAAEQTYQTGKKADDNAGCSTPTDAQSAGVDTSRKTVCTTSGADGVGAVDRKNRDNKKVAAATQSAQSTPSAQSAQATQSAQSAQSAQATRSTQSKAPKESAKETAESAAAAAPECKEISETKPGHCNPSQTKPQPPR